jgi:hypothetical protein
MWHQEKECLFKVEATLPPQIVIDCAWRVPWYRELLRDLKRSLYSVAHRDRNVRHDFSC